MLSYLKDLAIVIGTILTLFTFVNALLEYSRQGRQKRADQFTLLRRRFKENDTFKNITDLALREDPLLASLPAADKRDLLGLFEEVALMMNSGLIRKEVAHYMFGNYAIHCWESSYFWYNIERDSLYWQLFADFVREMKLIENNFIFKRRKMRF